MKTSNIISALVLSFFTFAHLSAASITIDNDHYKLRGTQASANGNTYAYVQAEATNGRIINKLVLQYFDSADFTNLNGEIDITDNLTNNISEYEVTIPADATVLRLKAVYSDEGNDIEEYSYYYDSKSPYVYGSDIDNTRYTSYNQVTYPDMCHGGTIKLNITGSQYNKGFGVHADGYVQFNITPGKYSRFVTDASKQNGKSGLLDFSLLFDDTTIASQTGVNSSTKVHWDYEIPAATALVKIVIGKSTDGNGQDWASMGGTRLYLTDNRQDQTITWDSNAEVNAFRDIDIPLTATSDSNLPVKYRIISGDEYASLDGSNLHINKVSSSCNIVVEAYQPGDDNWNTANSKTCTFSATNTCVVFANEEVSLENGENIEELVVYNDGTSSGQVFTEGMAQVERLIYKYTFTPNKWQFIAFPTDVNIENISNLTDLGYIQNATDAPSYVIKRFDGEAHANLNTADEWVTLDNPNLNAKKGYIMMISGSEPTELSFTLENVWLNPQLKDEDFSISFDFSSCEPGTTQSVYVRPQNVAGNTLKIDVDFRPDDTSVLPINYMNAVKNARITHTPHFEGIRLTLPDPTPAKVAIYNKSGKKLLKAVNYQSPHMIDVSDLKPGTYQLYVAYGNGFDVKTFTIPKK